MSARTKLKIWSVIAVLILVTAAPTFAEQIIYVDDGPADFDNIQAAIDDSSDGDTIIVAEGRYFENINFNGKNITLTSNDPCNPDVVAATIIDGNQNGSVVTFNSGEDANCVLNGFTITNGNAEHGGGMLNFESSPTITNCTFSNNSADFGGGMYNNQSTLILTNCTFTENSAIWAPIEAGKGGGMYNNHSSPMLTNCTFIDNSADSGGGGIYNYISSPILNNCTFSANLAEFDGIIPAIYAYPSRLGGGMYNDQSSPTLTNCMFNGNSVKDSGGGMYNLYSSPIVTNCAFTGNSATEGGGGMYNDWSNPILANCIFTRNSAAYGGGIYNGVDSNEALTNCTFIGNSADKAGGGMFHSNANITIMTNCRFIGNSTNANNTRSHAGGLYAHEGSVMLTNCVFSGNSTVRQGGGISTDQSDLTLINCTFSGNSALDRGGPMYCEESSSLTLTNCIVWANSPVQITLRDSKASISYSDIQGSWSGKGNIDADPCFVEIGYWDANGVWVEGDYHLLPGSPCIDAGDPNYLEEPNEVDLDGKPRVIGGRIDMGAYEAPILAEARILPRTINLASKGKWITCYIWLPEEYDVADIDPNNVFFEDEIQPEQFSVDEQAQLATARFSREEVQAILEVGEIELTITGQLTDGTIFEGTDTIKVTNKAGGKSAK